MQGKTINGFTLQRLLGTGGMAEVWYAENEIHKAAAVKILNVELSNNGQIVERFRNEAEIMVKLNHPNIRQVYGYGNIDGRPAIVMEYLEGSDLKARLKRGQRFTDMELKQWWNQLVSALNYTHKKGIVHRDIKPGNIFVDTEGNIKLLDFGIAKVRESISSTQTGQKLGTLMYMSPEQVKDSKHIDYRTDAYSLAVTFVHLLTGKRPYDSDTSSDFEISEQIVYKPLDLSGISSDWRSFLAPYLEKDPEKRPALRSFEVKAGNWNPPKGSDDDATFADASNFKETTNQTSLSEEGRLNKKVSSKEIVEPSSKRKVPVGLAVFVALSALVFTIGYFVEVGLVSILIVALAGIIAEIGLLIFKPKKFKALPWLIIPVLIGLVIWFEYTGSKGALNTNLALVAAAIPLIALIVILLLRWIPKGYFTDKPKAKWWVLGVVAVLVVIALIPKHHCNEKKLPNADLEFTVDGVSFVMKPVDGGTFQMGNNIDVRKDESPVHNVTVDSFYMAETEVTHALWYAVMGTSIWGVYNGYALPLDGSYSKQQIKERSTEACPMSWFVAMRFVRKLNRITGKTFRMPTEAEWEYAARGGNLSKHYVFAGSNTLDSVAVIKGEGFCWKYVKTKKPNELGLYDMSGNMWEWCSDWYKENYYKYSPPVNPLGPEKGEWRVIRGGSYDSGYGHEVWKRSSEGPGETRYGFTGLRLVLSK